MNEREVLFTPWRLSYLQTGEGLPPGACLFCVLPDADPAETLIVHRGASAYVVLNRFPYSNGHLMVTPYAHRATLTELEPRERAELVDLAAAAESVLAGAYKPHGFNMGINLGKSGGAGVPGHIHLHVVPRWEGDTNFMSVTASTRVVPEDLTVTRDRLARAFAGG